MNATIYDFVDDVQQFMNSYNIMIVPLFSGSGMRIKIMEGLGLGKPVITTTIGAEGIAVADRENIFIADTPEDMIHVIDFCVNNIKECEKVGKKARSLVEEKYAQKIISQNLIQFAKRIIALPSL
jgi:glycosyltransferase involved in cell wall biosynthesis